MKIVALILGAVAIVMAIVYFNATPPNVDDLAWGVIAAGAGVVALSLPLP